MLLVEGNQSSVTLFILLGFSEYPNLQVPLFLVFLTIYTVTLVGNLGIIVAIRINPKLHRPMYFFLSHLSFLDICYSSVFTPKLLEILVVEDRTISFKGCMVQYFFGCTFVITEMFMLAVMAYDRFVAVCNPLLYTVTMSHKLCKFLLAGTYTYGGTCSLTITYSLLELSFCGSNIISHFGFVTIIQMPSTGGLRKAFSTCASHLTAITIFHGIILLLYCVPNSKNSWLLVKSLRKAVV
ncbi:olfactory receptor 1165-like isoform X2 [Equus przewalskii]|uniref:Olfactory receptor 1165-like isoform X2 n=1 Tax=Equus przewalskii TaxID=9798 RepID=A0ABM4K1P5_EQUPR